MIDYVSKDGRKAKVYVFIGESYATHLLLRRAYGALEVYVRKTTPRFRIEALLNKSIAMTPMDHIIDRPFMIKDRYIYVLGKKKYFTDDVRYKNSDLFYYVSSATKDIEKKYKADFLKYMKERVPLLGKRMNLDLSEWQIHSSIYKTYYGCCKSQKKVLNFDYRVYAYHPEIIDALIYHELMHIFFHNHQKQFQTLLRLYCPDYDELDGCLKRGKFEWRSDEYRN